MSQALWKPAAVCVCLVWEHEWQVLVIRRADALSEHPGQCGLPGGRPVPQDRSLWETARRETFEEVGVWLTDAQCQGALEPVVVRGSGYEIVPWIALCESRPKCVLNAAEVASAHWISQTHLAASRRQTESGWVYKCPDGTIWGATARILHQLELWEGWIRS
ncbi:CoA pyrophosphatase [Sulfobacillus sp. hq2]|uniref:NUDIX hydrolase n=1 Tax=Sulfobacillus TaxID=28033 RepID=UPI000CD035D9|nr:CoA pyrophosphatase [Sulfobacillus sp. hq2]POB11114.1 coenzyme A pyrophosphatase [Sulfobacillus sp. hq2]